MIALSPESVSPFRPRVFFLLLLLLVCLSFLCVFFRLRFLVCLREVCGRLRYPGFFGFLRVIWVIRVISVVVG